MSHFLGKKKKKKSQIFLKHSFYLTGIFICKVVVLTAGAGCIRLVIAGVAFLFVVNLLVV